MAVGSADGSGGDGQARTVKVAATATSSKVLFEVNLHALDMILDHHMVWTTATAGWLGRP